MKKAKERDELVRVFGPSANAARDFERPDFLIDRRNDGSLGVEVTSIYASNADAKLKVLPEYVMSLLEGKQKVHKGDRGSIAVEEVTLLRQDGTFVDKFKGIIQERPSPNARIDLLFSKIAEKEAKACDYLLHCSDVDLIVRDGSGLFYHKSHEDFCRPFFHLMPKRSLISSPFREIHLLTTAADRRKRSVNIPLVANIFAADCFAYQHLLDPEIKSGRPNEEIFQLLAACLLHEGYIRAKVSVSDEGIGLFYGAWELLYTAGGRQFRSWGISPSPYNGHSLAEALADVPRSILEEANSLTSQRSKWFSAIDIRLQTLEA